MTGKDGKILAECATNMALLQATGQAMNKALGEMQADSKLMRESFNEQKISTVKLESTVDRLVLAVDKLEDNLDTKIDYKIEKAQESCVVRKAVNKKTERDITKKLLPPSNPPAAPDTEDEIAKTIRRLPKKMQIIVGIVLTICIVAAACVTIFT